MNSTDIRQIRIGKHNIGIIGLEAAVKDLADANREMTDEEIQKELLKRLSKRNYISDHVKSEYGKAFLDEYRKFIGQPGSRDLLPNQMEIKILGQGCHRCEQLTKDVMGVVAQLKINADVEHVTDISRIAQYGVMGTPALVVNGEIKSVGQIPSKQKISTWLKETG